MVREIFFRPLRAENIRKEAGHTCEDTTGVSLSPPGVNADENFYALWVTLRRRALELVEGLGRVFG